MNVYEITNGFVGYSYVRCYVLASSEKEAITLAREKYKDNAHNRVYQKLAYYKNLRAEKILDINNRVSEIFD